MSRLYLVLVDFLVIAAGMAWAYVAGRHSLIMAREGWPHGTIGAVLMAVPLIGMALQMLFVWLASAGRPLTATWLAVFSLAGALALIFLETFSHFVGYR